MTYEPLPPDGSFEALNQPLDPESECLGALLDLKQVQQYGRLQDVHGFFETFSGQSAPEDLSTSIDAHPRNGDDNLGGQTVTPQGADIVATVVVKFDSEDRSADTMLNLDFVNTVAGLKLYQKQWLFIDGERVPRYTRMLTEAEVAALGKDAHAIRERIIETDMERMKLGPLVEEAGEDGARRFHVGDVLTVMTGRLLSPRGVEGAYDILHYMTGEDPYTTQLGRFMQECAPQLKERFEELLSPYYEQLEQGRLSEVDLFKLLTRISEDIGTSMLEVGTIDSSDHAVIDPMTEMELDYGPEIRKKMITFDTENGEERKDDEDE